MIHLTIGSRYHYPMMGLPSWIKTFSIVPELIVFSTILFLLLFLIKTKKVCYFFAVYSSLVFSMLLAYYFLVDQKILLFISFFFAITAVVNWYFMYWERNLACYEPSYNNKNVMRSVCYQIPCSLFLKTKNQDSVEQHCGLITNWDESSCYVKIEKTVDFDNLDLRQLIEIKLDFIGQEFSGQASFVTCDKKLNGLGLKLLAKDSDKKNGYNRFIELVNDLGLVKSHLR